MAKKKEKKKVVKKVPKMATKKSIKKDSGCCGGNLFKLGWIFFSVGLAFAFFNKIVTGAVIGFSATSLFGIIGILSFLAGLALLFEAERRREKEGDLVRDVDNEAAGLLKKGKIMVRSQELKRLANRMGYQMRESRKSTGVYDNGKKVTDIPHHKDVNYNRARKIMNEMSESYET